MDINNPQNITYIKEIDGETVRPEALDDTELGALTAETEGIGWKKDSDGKYYLPSGFASKDGTPLRIFYTELGAWDMQTNANLDIELPFTWSKMRAAFCMIRGDSNYESGYFLTTSDMIWPGSASIQIYKKSGLFGNYIRLTRDGSFNSSNFDYTAGPYNRGYLIVIYEP